MENVKTKLLASKINMLSKLRKHEKHLMNSASFFVMRVAVYAASLIVIPFFIHARGQGSYGIIAFFSTMISYSVLLESALSYAVSLRYTRSLVDKSKDSIHIIQSAIPVYFLFGSLIFAALLLFAKPLSVFIWGSDQYVRLIDFLAAILFFQVIDAFFSSIIQSYNDLFKLNLNRLISDVIRIFGLFFAASFESALEICLAFFFLGAIAKIYLDAKYCNKIIKLKGWFRPALSIAELKENAKLAPFMFINSSLWMIISCFDKIYVAKQVSVHEYAYYAFAVDVCVKAHVLFYAITGTLYNSLIRRYAGGVGGLKILKAWAMLLCAISCFYYLPLYLWGDVAIEYFIDHEFSVHTMPIVKVLIFASLSYLALAILENNMNAQGKASHMVFIYIIGLVCLYFSFNYMVDKRDMVGVARSILFMYLSMLFSAIVITLKRRLI